jgi:hypothetical protein
MESTDMAADSSEDKVVGLRVLLTEGERTEFKIECAKERTTMSQKAKELITDWMEERKAVEDGGNKT